VKQIFTPLHIAFPDPQIEIEDLIAEGDKVVGRVMARGTTRASSRASHRQASRWDSPPST
jgi:hypothetical protein